MFNHKNIVLLLGSVIFGVFLTGCSTGYHSSGWFTGGYSDFKTTSDTFVVTFKGNGYTSSDKVYQYALKRASEITIKNGYKYFSVISTADQTRSYAYTDTFSHVNGSASAYKYSNFSNAQISGYGSSSTYSGQVIKPGLSIAIKCFKRKPWLDDVIDAEYFLDNN